MECTGTNQEFALGVNSSALSTSAVNKIAAAIPAAPTATDNANAVWSAGTRALTDKAGFSLSGAAEDSIVSKVWSSATRTLTGFGTLVSDIWTAATRTLTQTIPTAAQNASQVRTELTTELNRIDAAVSSRATQTSVNAIPTNSLLTTDTRLNNLDAAVSSRATPAQVDSQLADNFAAVLAAIAALPDNTTAINSILSRVNQITITNGLVNATIGSQTVNLSSVQSEQLLRLYQLAGLDTSNPSQIAQDYQLVAGVRLNITESNGIVQISRQP